MKSLQKRHGFPRRALRSGFALLTGLFTVSILFLMATVVVGNAQHNFSFTRRSLESAQAGQLASAGISFALYQLNQPGGESWETACLSTPYIDPSGAFKISMRPGPDASRIYLHVEGLSGPVTFSKQTLLRKRRSVARLKYCTMNGVSDSSQSDTLWFMDSSKIWHGMMEPYSYQNPPGTYPFDWAVSYKQPAGDSHGNMYVIADHPGQGTDIMYWRRPDNLWKLCPNVPLPAGFTNPRISDLAVQPESGVFCFVRYPGTTKPTSLYYLDSPYDTTWQAIPPIGPPGSAPPVTNPGPPKPPGNGGNWDFDSIACDGNKLYVLQRNSSRIYRFTPSDPLWSTGVWDPIPQPVTKRFALVNGQLQGPYPDAAEPVVKWLLFLAVDPTSSQVFARAETKTNVDTIYRYAPEPSNPDNSVWSADPLPAPGFYYSRSKHKWQRIGGKFPDLINYVCDHAANLSAYWSRDDEDTHYSCDLTKKIWQEEFPVSNGNPNVNEVGVSAANCTGLGGGGIDDPGGRTSQYVPLYSD
jgi:hypothetical protein